MHKILEKQLRRLGVLPGESPTAAQWAELLGRISQTYVQHDQDRYLLERSLDISSAEMRGLNDELRAASASALAEERDRLRAALQAADAANEAKSQFLAVMSHEIRTPINGVTGMLQLLGRTALDRTQQSYLETARGSAEALLSQVNQILDFSRIEAGQMALDCADFPLAEVVTEWVRNFAPVASEKHLELIVDAPPSAYRLVNGDSARLRQIVFNLLGNALKFTATGHICVRVAEPREMPDGLLELRIDVEDSGIGIPPDGLGKLFQPFSQVDASTTRKFGGTGLGLVVSQRLAALMGGSIAVQSAPGVGSVFSLIVMVGATASPGVLLGSRCSPCRIVVLSGHTLAAQSLAGNLRLAGADVQVVASVDALVGELAASKGVSGVRRVLVWDWDPALAGPAGERLVAAARASAVDSICVLAAAGDLATAGIRELQPGIDSLLMKPVSLPELLAGIEPQAPAIAREPQAAPAAPLLLDTRILIAEDNEVNRLILIESLRHLGYECDVAVNGREALEAANARRYDLILMDCQMPELDGYAATAGIRDDEARRGVAGGPPVPIVALTANALQGDRERCLAAGMTDYAVKPLSISNLQQLVERYVGRRRPTELPARVSVVPAGQSSP